MRKRKNLARMHDLLGEKFGSSVDLHFLDNHNIETKSEWNSDTLKLSVAIAGGVEMTPEQMAELRGYSNGYAAAMGTVYLEFVGEGPPDEKTLH